MNFIEAVKAAMDGKKIRRACWGSDGFGFLTTCKDGMSFVNEDNDGCHVLHLWVLADDWEIVPEPPKTMSFIDAWAEAKKGRKIARLKWGNGIPIYAEIIERNGSQSLVYRELDDDGTYIIRNLLMHVEYIDATDWYVVEENEEVSND